MIDLLVRAGFYYWLVDVKDPGEPALQRSHIANQIYPLLLILLGWVHATNFVIR